MGFKLKQRMISYLVIFIITLLFGKLIFVNENCKKTSTTSPPDLHRPAKSVDPFNLNEHHIELEMVQAINKIKRSNSKVEVEPINEPVIDETQMNTDIIHTQKNLHQNPDWGPHQLGIIVPYRNRFEELKDFVPYMHKYLSKQKINHKIFVMNQVDSHRFNRASLINAGFLLARNSSCDYIAMHDVDLVPLNDNLNYGYPDLGPFHVAAPNLHPKYHYKTFVGGILLLSVDQFEELNGLSNKFWGWGREDDEFYMRIVDKGYKIYRHGAEIDTGYNTFKHFHGPERRRDHYKLPGQKKSMFSRDRETGLNTLQHTIVKRQQLHIDGYPCSVVDVSLDCDMEFTPWCDFPPEIRHKVKV